VDDDDPVALTGQALDFAGRARASMCAEFGVRYVSEVATLARLHRVPRRGRCSDGLRYDIHGNGYDAYLDETTPLTIQGHGYAPADRPAGPDDGLYDCVDLFALRDFLRDRTGTTFGLDPLRAACEEHVRRGALHAVSDVRYRLPAVPGRVEERQ
jgi:hypothetical protein